MTVYSIPLTSGAQKFQVSLGDQTVQIRLVWRTAEGGGWFMDVMQTDGTAIVAGVPLRCGVNLFDQYEYLGLGKMQCMLDGDDSRDPDYEDMGTNLQLYWEPWQDNTSDTAN